MRIVSLVPSLTHTVASIDALADQLLGCTNYCVDPPWVARKAKRLGGTKDASIEALKPLRATHILLNREENTPAIVQSCRELAPVFEAFPKSPFDVVHMLSELSAFLDENVALKKASRRLQHSLSAWQNVSMRPEPSVEQPTYLYLIWRDPYMAAGSDTYISRSLELLGLKNCLSQRSDLARYPSLTIDDIKPLQPQWIFFASEPFPFRNRHLQEFRELWGEAKQPQLAKVDGKLLSWHGIYTLELFGSRLHPDMSIEMRVAGLSR